MNKKYEDLYIAKAKEYSLRVYHETARETPENVDAKLREELKKPREEAEARRYLLVNGWMPFTPKNIEGLDEFYIRAKYLPRKIIKELLKKTQSPEGLLDVTDADLDEEEEIRMVSNGRPQLEGTWIKDGKPSGFKIYVERTVRVGTTFNFPSEKP